MNRYREKHFLLLLNNLRCGGTENQAVLIANELSVKYPTTMLLFSARSKDELFLKERLNQKVSLVNLSSRFKLLAVVKLLWYFMRTKLDYVLTYNSTSNLLSVFIRLTNRKANITANVRGYQAHNFKYLSIWGKYVSGVIVNSKEIKNSLVNKYGINKPVLYIKNGVEPVNIKQKVHQEFNVLMVGRLNRVKNHFDLLRAANRLKHTPIKFKLVGGIQDNDYSNELHNYVKEHNLENVEFCGESSQPSEFYQIADLVIICSKSEGLPNVLLESIIWEIPIISTPVGAIPEVLKDVKYEAFYKLGDDALLAERIAYFSKMESEELTQIKDSLSWIKKEYLIQNRVNSMLQALEYEKSS